MAWHDELDTFIGGTWATLTADKKTEVYESIFGLLVPKNADLAKQLAEVFGKGTDPKVLVSRWLEKSAFDLLKNAGSFKDLKKDVLEGIAKDAANGNLSMDDVIVLGSSYLAFLQPSGPTRDLFKAVSDGVLKGKKAEDAIYEFIKKHLKVEVETRIKELVGDSSQFSSNQLAMTMIAPILAKGGIAATNTQDIEKAFIKYLENLAGPDLETYKEILKALSEKDPTKFAIKLVKHLGVGVQDGILKQFIGDLDPNNPSSIRAAAEKAVQDAFVGALKDKGVGSDHATAIGKFVGLVLKGEKSFAVVSEQADLGLSAKRYGQFCRVRQVLYAAAVAVKGGPIIPTTASGSLYGVIASKMTAETKIATLVPKDDFVLYKAMARSWMLVEFAQDVQPPIPDNWPIPEGVQTAKITIRDVFDTVRNII